MFKICAVENATAECLNPIIRFCTEKRKEGRNKNKIK